MASITHSRSESAADASRASLGLAARLVPASLSLAAGAIHLAMAPIHAGESTTEAIGFAIAGWAQILLAAGLLLRPTRPVLTLTIVVNLAIISLYIWSRTFGLPWGAHPGESEGVEAIDLMATIFAGALVVIAGVLLARPDLAEFDARDGFTFESIAVASAIPLLVLAATSVALADPEITQHGADGGGALASSGGGGHGHGGAALVSADLASVAEDRCDLDINPAAYWREATLAGVDTITGGANPVPVGKIEGSTELDSITALHTTVEGEVGDAQMVLALSGISDEVYDDWLRWTGATGMSGHAHGDSNVAAPDDTTMGGHLGPQPWIAMTDPAECAKLREELQLARDTALKYPTVAEAKAAGWRQVTPYVAGIAAHFMNFGLVDDKFEIDKPEMILYDGTDDDSKVIGLSYYLRHDGDAEPTQGFAGPNDHYHRHIGLCVNASGVIGDSTTTEEECEAMGGRKSQGGNGWMNHAWVVPGCESPWGMFSGASPLLEGDLGEDAGKSGPGCVASGVRDRYNLDPGTTDNVPTAAGGDVEMASSN